MSLTRETVTLAGMALLVGGTNPPFPAPEPKPSAPQHRVLKPEPELPVSTAPRFILLRLLLAGIAGWAGVNAYLMFQLGKTAMHETSAWVAAGVSVTAFVGLAVVEAIRKAVVYLKED